MMTIAILGIFLVVAMGAGLYVAGRVPGTANWVLGGIAGVLGLGGLFVSSRSGVHAAVGYYGGLVLFVIGLVIVFYFVKLALDEAEKHRH